MAGQVHVALAPTVHARAIGGGRVSKVANNWIIGDDDECLVIDPVMSPTALADAVAGRRVVGIVCTRVMLLNGGCAAELAAATGAEVVMHPSEQPAWRALGHDLSVTRTCEVGAAIGVGHTLWDVLGTPRYSPGQVSLYCGSLNAVVTGEALCHNQFGTLEEVRAMEQAVKAPLFSLPTTTQVYQTYGSPSNIAEQRGSVAAAVIRALLPKRLPGEEVTP